MMHGLRSASALVASLLASSIVAQDHDAARKLVERCEVHYRSLPAFRCVMAVTTNFHNAWLGPFTITASVVVAGPDRFAYRGEDGVLISDGKHLLCWRSNYSIGERNPLEDERTGWSHHVAEDLISYMTRGQLVPKGAEINDVGEEEADGWQCRAVQIGEDTLWIDVGERPWIRRWVTAPTPMGNNPANGNPRQSKTSLDVTFLRPSIHLRGETFDTTPPADVRIQKDALAHIEYLRKRLEHIPPALRKPSDEFRLEEPRPVDGLHELAVLDEFVPDVKLGKLNEGEPNGNQRPERLRDLRGRHVIVHFFEAVDSAADRIAALARLEQKAVAVRFVACGARPRTIETFMERHSLDVRYTVDLEEALQDVFDVREPSLTAIIDPRGTLVALHQSWQPDTLARTVRLVMRGGR